jgi:hypothetical protein
MDFPRWRSEWGELLVASLISFILYQMNMIVLFCIPLQILFIRKGERNLLYGCAAVMAALVVSALIRTTAVDDSVLRRGILLSEIALPVAFLAGLIGVNYRWNGRLRTLYKVLGVALAAGVVSIPVIYLLNRNDGFTNFLKNQVGSVVGLLQSGTEEGSDAVGLFQIDVDLLTEAILGIALRNYLFAYFLTIAGSVWLGRSIAARLARTRGEGLRTLHIPDRLIWPLLVSWALVLADVLVGIGAVTYAAWNIGLIGLFVFGMQGIGIIQTILDRRLVSRQMRIVITAVMVLLVFWPGVNLVVLIGLPILGVSELWIHYRKERKE